MKRGTKTIIGAVIIAAVALGTYSTLANYVAPLREMFALTTSQTTLIFTAHSILSLVTSLFFGRIIKKFPARLIIAFGGLCILMCFLSIYFAQSITTVYIGVALQGASCVFSGIVMGQTLVVWWADKNPGRAVSFVAIGFAFCAFVISPIIAKGIISIGLRATAIIHGILGASIIWLADIFLISERPEHYGIEMKAEVLSDSVEKDDTISDNTVNPFKTYQFWLIFAGIVIFNFAINGFLNNAAVFYQSIGVDAVQASYGVSIYGIVAVAWSYIYGLICDKKSPRAGIIACASVGMVTLFAATVLRGMVGVAVIATGMASLNIAGAIAAVAFPYVFGKSDSGRLIGLGNVACSTGGMIAAPIAARFYDLTGSYNGFLYTACALTVLCIAAIYFGVVKK